MLLSRLNHPRLRFLALAALSAVLIGLLWRSDDQGGPTVGQELRGPDEPDSFVVNGEYRSFDEQGQLTTVISSPRIEQFDAQNRAHMQQPRATMIDADSGQPWHMRADEGNYRTNRDVIDLSGNVVISRVLASGSEGSLETTHLTLDNQKRIVHTDAPVLLRDPRGTTRATGMKAWIDQRIVQLQSQVEGQYELSPSQ